MGPRHSVPAPARGLCELPSWALAAALRDPHSHIQFRAALDTWSLAGSAAPSGEPAGRGFPLSHRGPPSRAPSLC